MYFTLRMGNMSTLEDSITAPENFSHPIEKPMVIQLKSKKRSSPQSFRQKLQTLQARIKYREQAIKGMRQHLQKGTFPKRFKSLKPYPKMYTAESQAIVNAACQQVENVIFDQSTLDEEKKLAEDKNLYQTMKEERNLSQKPRKPTRMAVMVGVLQQELRDLQSKCSDLTDLQSKYNELYSKLDNQTATGL